MAILTHYIVYLARDDRIRTVQSHLFGAALTLTWYT